MGKITTPSRCRRQVKSFLWKWKWNARAGVRLSKSVKRYLKNPFTEGNFHGLVLVPFSSVVPCWEVELCTETSLTLI